MTMKPLCSILVATSFGIVSAVEPVTTETTSMLRGSKVTRRRTVYPLSHQIEDDRDSLVDAPEHHHSYVKLRGRSNDGKASGISISMDLDKLEDYYKEHIQYHDHIRRGQGLSSNSEENLSDMADEEGFANPSESPNRNGGHLRSHEMNDAATEENYEYNLQEDYRNGGYLRSHDFEDNDVSEDDDEYYFQADYGYEGEADEEQNSSSIWSSALVQEQVFEAQFLFRKSAIQEPEDEEENSSNIWSSAIVQKQVFEAQFHLGATQETDGEEQAAQFHLRRSGTGEKDIGLLGAHAEENFNEEDAYGFQGNFDQQLNQTVSEIAREDMPLEQHSSNRNDVHFGRHTPLDIHRAKHDAVEKDHHHHHYHHHHDDARFEKNEPENTEEKDEEEVEEAHPLPTGLADHFNETRFHDLFDAPFYIYEQALGHDVIVGEPFPIFSMPVWEAVPGKIFSGFNKIGEALYFQNDNFLLDWEGMKSSSTSSGNDLQDFIANSNFESHLVVGKAIRRDSVEVPFLGLVVSYYQKGSKEYTLVPLAHLEDFFDEPSGESRVLHHLLEQKRPANDTSNFYYPDLVWSDYMGTQEIKEKLEDLESIHFQKLYQLLIKRSFLFSYGYADCLRRDPNSKDLRVCLDYTFYEIVKIETGVRGALEDQLLGELSELDKSFHSNVKEACLSFEGGMIGTDSCTQIPTNHLATFFASSFQSF